MMKRQNLLLLPVFMLILGSCGVNSNLMLKTPNDWDKYADENNLLDTANVTKDEYIIDVNDIVMFQFFTNDGQKIIDFSTNQEPGQTRVFNLTNNVRYVIQKDSTVKLPLLGEVNLVGKTIREAETFLETEYAGEYVDPFVQISVTNRRVIVFPGNGGDAQVLYLQNNNTTLLEAIALAGGITDRGRASRIKLIRKDENGKRQVYKLDLSVIDNLVYTDVVVKANDYIYVEPAPQLGREILAEVAPIVSLITSAATIIAVITALTP